MGLMNSAQDSLMCIVHGRKVNNCAKKKKKKKRKHDVQNTDAQ